MAAANLNFLQFSSAQSSLQSKPISKKFKLTVPSSPSSSSFFPQLNNGISRSCAVKCSSSDSSGKPSDSREDSQTAEQKRRAELSARNASGEFTVEKSGFGSVLRNELPKFGVPTKVVEIVSRWADSSEDYPKIPEAKGAISAIRSEAFFIPLYELFFTCGGLFRLTFGPKV